MGLENQRIVQIGGNWVIWDGSICRERLFWLVQDALMEILLTTLAVL